MDFFTSKFPSPEVISKDVNEFGYKVYPDAINSEIYQVIREFWLDYFSKNKPERNIARGNIRLGEENFNSYSETKFWRLYRHFDFLWNEPTHELTMDVTVGIHKKRNLAQNLNEDYGLNYNPKGYGIYISTSYYMPETGFCKIHADAHDKEIALLHFMLPITFKGKDYKEGGLVCNNKNGEKIDVDELMEPGSIVFYDGRQEHGVETIIPYPDKNIGRLAVFAIPTFFLKQNEKPSSQGKFSRLLSRVK